MDTELLRALCTIAAVLGILLTGAGGFGAVYFGRLSHRANGVRMAAETELQTRISRLQEVNEQLQQRLKSLEASAPVLTASRQTIPMKDTGNAGTATAIARVEQLRPHAPVKTPTPILTQTGTAVWTGQTPDLEQMLESAYASEAKKGQILSEKQRHEISRLLGKHEGGTLAIHSIAGDDQGFQFAKDLKRVFVEAGWRIGTVDQISYAKPPEGLSVSTEKFPVPKEVVVASEALTAAGFNVSQQLDSKLGGESSVLLVGRLIR